MEGASRHIGSPLTSGFADWLVTRLRSLGTTGVLTLTITSLVTGCTAVQTPSATANPTTTPSAVAVSARPGGTLERILREKKVRVAMTGEKPWNFLAPDGSVTGIEPELLRQFFASLGVTTLEPVSGDFASVLPGLQADRSDVTAAGLYIRNDRCALLAFGDPEVVVGFSFLVKKGNPFNLHTFKDLVNNPSVTVGAIAGGAESKTARAVGVPDSRILDFPDQTSRFAAMASDRVQVLIGNAISQLQLASTHPELDYVALSEQPAGALQYAAVAFRKDDTDLATAYNKWLAAARTNGAVLATLQKFGLTKDQIPGSDATAAKLCGQ